MPDGVGVVKSIIDKFFERVKSLSMVAWCCILVYMIAHASKILPGWMSTYLEIPQVIIPWVNLLGFIGLSWLVVEWLYGVKTKIHDARETRRRNRLKEVKAERRRQMQEAAYTECENMVSQQEGSLFEVLAYFIVGMSVIELDARSPEVVYLCKKNIIEPCGTGYLTASGKHMRNYTLTPWIADYVAMRQMDSILEENRKNDNSSCS